MESSAATQCLLCRAPLGEVLVSPDRFERAAGISANNYLRQWRDCPACGAVCDLHLSPEADKLERWMTDYYEVEQAIETMTEKFARIMALPPEQSDNRQRVARVIAAADRWLPSGTRRSVVDVGSGMGVFLAALTETPGWQGLAIEPSPQACEHLRRIGGFRVQEGLFSAELGLGGHDLITFNKVIEHIRHPHSVLRDARAAVAPSGLIYVEVPHRLSAYCHPAEHFILGALHHHLYSVPALTRLLEECGWVTLEAGTTYDPSGKVTAYALAGLPERAILRGQPAASPPTAGAQAFSLPAATRPATVPETSPTV